MTKTIVICDMCGKEISQKKGDLIHDLRLTTRGHEREPDAEYELCMGCAVEVWKSISEFKKKEGTNES